MVLPHHAVRGQHDLVRSEIAERPPGPVIPPRRHVRSEPRELPLPRPEQCRRTDHQGRPAALAVGDAARSPGSSCPDPCRPRDIHRGRDSRVAPSTRRPAAGSRAASRATRPVARTARAPRPLAAAPASTRAIHSDRRRPARHRPRWSRSTPRRAPPRRSASACRRAAASGRGRGRPAPTARASGSSAASPPRAPRPPARSVPRPSSVGRHRKATSSFKLKSGPVTAPGVGVATVPRTANSPANSSVGQSTSIPAPSNAVLPSANSSSASSSTPTSDGAASRNAAPSGGHTRAPRRNASSRSVSARSPSAARTAAGALHTSSTSTNRLGSTPLRNCSTALNSASSSGGSIRSTNRAPAASLCAVSSSHAVAPVTSTGSAAANADAPGRTATAAAGVRTSVSAIASQNARTNCSGSTSRTGRVPSIGKACAYGDIAVPRFLNQPRSSGSSGATRHAPYPSGLRSGTSRPRAINPTPANAAARHASQLAEPNRPSDPTRLSDPADPSRSRTSEIASIRAGTTVRRTCDPFGSTSSTVPSATSPAAARSPYSANRPARGGSAGTKTASNMPCTVRRTTDRFPPVTEHLWTTARLDLNSS